MRFTRLRRYTFVDTPRKRAALARKQRLELEAFPLFAEQLRDEQEHPDQVMADRHIEWAERDVRRRQLRAREWRNVRACLRKYPEAVRAALCAYWQRCSWPADPEYLFSMLRLYDDGRLSLAGELIHDYGGTT